MVECERSVRSGPRVTLRLGDRARRRVEGGIVAAALLALTACLVNADARAGYEVTRGAKLRKLYWEQERRGVEYASAFHRAQVYTRVLEERLARYEPGQQTTWRRDAFRRAERESAERD